MEDRPEFKDRRLKYVELPKVFRARATDVLITSKQHLRACEKLAEHLSKVKPKTPKEFEQNEWLKDFVIKSSKLNESTIELLDYIKFELTQVAEDAKTLMEGGQILDRLRDQQETIEVVTQQREKAIREIYDLKKQQLRQDKAIAQ